MHPRSLVTVAAGVALAATTATAQLNLTLVRQFVDTHPGPYGNIGVTQDESALDYYVIAFNNPQNVHKFNLLGTPTTTFTATPCSPSQPSPNDITYDPLRDCVWLVDNNGNSVLKMSKTGTCQGGFGIPIAVTNPVGIAFDRNHDTLFVSHTGNVMQLSLNGTLLAGGFAFVPTPGSNILSGITYVPQTDRFLITQSSGNRVFEVDRTGALLSTTPLAAFGVINTQGLHYNPVMQELAVVDNSLSTTFVFSLVFCNGIVAHRGVGCPDGSGQTMVIGATGCANIGGTLNLQALASPSVLPMLFAGGVSDTYAGTLPLPFDLGLIGGPAGCQIYTSSDVLLAAAMVGSSATLPFAIPPNPAVAGSRVFFQAFKLDPLLAAPLQLASSNYVDVIVY
jgi:hypothetical protein